VRCRASAPDDLADQLTAALLAEGHADDVAFLVYRQPPSAADSSALTKPALIRRYASATG
jgi:hypothetical protein